MIGTSFNRNFVKVSFDDLSQVLEGLTANPKVIEIVIRNISEDKEEHTVSEYLEQFLKKFFVEKVEETAGHSLEYAGSVLRQLIPGF